MQLATGGRLRPGKFTRPTVKFSVSLEILPSSFPFKTHCTMPLNIRRLMGSTSFGGIVLLGTTAVIEIAIEEGSISTVFSGFVGRYSGDNDNRKTIIGGARTSAPGGGWWIEVMLPITL